jgi:hypothetical protein
MFSPSAALFVFLSRALDYYLPRDHGKFSYFLKPSACRLLALWADKVPPGETTTIIRINKLQKFIFKAR